MIFFLIRYCFEKKVGTAWNHFGALVKQNRARIVSERRTTSLCATEKCNQSEKTTAGQPFSALEVGTFIKKKWDPQGDWHYQNQFGTVPKYMVYKFSTVTMILASMRPQNFTEDQLLQELHQRPLDPVPVLGGHA